MRPGLVELEPHAVERVLAVVHEGVDRAEPLEQRWELVLRPPEDQRPPFPQLGRNQPAGLRPGRDPGAPLALVEGARLVVAADLAREVDGVEPALAVPVQREQREGGRESVRDARLDGDQRPHVPEQRVQVRAFRVADRAERMPAAGDRRLMLAALVEQVLAQAAGLHFALVPGEHVVTSEEVRDLGSDPARLDQAPRVSQGANRPVKRASQAADRIVARLDVSDARILHLPVNLAGTGWAHVNALRRKGVDARLLVFWPQRWRPEEYDIDLDLPRQGLVRQQLVQ